ncbi:MAG: hypothetical protein Q8S54_19815 [Bacteroidota bacterium]|nr:hypothetical protein [Bacteroidota bacterium]
MKNTNELEELKVVLLLLNETHNLFGTYDFVFKIFLSPSGFFMKESGKVFDLRDMKIENSEKQKLYKVHAKMSTVSRHALTIMTKSIKGKDFERQVNFLIKKTKSLPDYLQDGMLNDIQNYIQEKENLVTTNQENG